MNESFRLRRSIQVQGIVSTLLCMTGTVASASMMFLDEPENHGFADEPSAAIVAGLGVTVFGGMMLLSVYMIGAYYYYYYAERVAVIGKRVFVRTVFRNRRFDTSEVDELVWKAEPVGGRLEFRVQNQKAKLDLYGFRDEDRLRMIRLFRCLIPAEKQADWALFCHKVALPLRDRRLDPSTFISASEFAKGEFIITRQRYDQLGVVVLPATLILASAVWWATASPVVFALPACIASCWLLLCYSVRREGERQQRLSAAPGGRTMLFGVVAVCGTMLLILALQLAGVSQDTACTIGLPILVPAVPIVIYGLHRADKQQRREAAIAAAEAPERWARGEASISPFPLCDSVDACFPLAASQ